MRHNPIGKAVHRSSRAITFDTRTGEHTITGLKARIIVHVRTGSAYWRKQWKAACHRWNLSVGNGSLIEVQQLGDESGDAWVTVYDVCASPEALADITARDCIDEWYNAMAARTQSPLAQHWCVGSGPEKVRSRPPMVAKEPRSRMCPGELLRWREERDGMLPDCVTQR